MAEAHPMVAVPTEAQPGHGSTPNPWQGDLDALKQEIKDLRTMLGSLVKEIKELKKVKVEAAELCVPSAGIEVKSEPLDAVLGVDSEEVPAPAGPEDDPDHERMVVVREEQEQVVADGPEDASQDAGDPGEQITSAPSQRETTEEPIWVTPPCEEVLFRVNPEYAQRVARANEVAAPLVRAPTPPQPREEAPPPPPVVRSARMIGIIPASQAKRKRDFELIIEVPAKRLKASNRPTLNSSSNGSVASSSRITLDTPVAASTRAPVKPPRRLPGEPVTRKVPSTPFKVNLDPKIRDVIVTREFMWSWFGAGQIRTFAEPPKDRVDKHGYDHFVFVHGEGTPQAPGEHGIITLFDEKPWPVYEHYRLFRRVKTFKWQYVGLYKATKLPAWTPEEMKRQRYTVKAKWSVKIKESKWARRTLARIMLREEFGREPTKNEVYDQIKKLNSKPPQAHPPSLNTIITALESGEEKLYPWKLECEGYEDNLQWEIAVTSPRHEKDRKVKKSDAPGDT